MGALFNILTNSIGSIFIGILITLMGMALMFYIIKSWYKNRKYTLLSYLLGGVFFFLLVYHAIIICGAITIKDYGDDLEELVDNYVGDLPDNTVFSQEETQAILERLGDDLPIVGYYADYADFSGHTPQNIARSMNESMQSFMNEYIVEHLLWSLFFVILGAFLIIKTMKGGKVSNNRKKTYSRSEEQF